MEAAKADLAAAKQLKANLTLTLTNNNAMQLKVDAAKVKKAEKARKAEEEAEMEEKKKAVAAQRNGTDARTEPLYDSEGQVP